MLFAYFLIFQNGFVDHFDNVNNASIDSSNFNNKLVKKYDSNYNPAANRSFQLSIRNLFCKISQVIGLTFTSLGKLNFLKDFSLFLEN